GFDAGMLIRSLRASLANVGRDRAMTPDFASRGVEPASRGGYPHGNASAGINPTARQKSFRVALTGDFTSADGTPKYRDIGLNTFDGANITVQSFAQHRAEIGADQLAGSNGVIVLTPRVTAASLANNPDLLAVGRFGVGYDTVDVAACTAADVMLIIAAGAVDRPVAEATIRWMLAPPH